jgi:hypothetical protein
MTETQIPNKFNSVLLKNHEKASGCVARNCYQYFGHNFHDKFHRDRRLYDSGIYSCGSDKHKHCNNTVSRYVPPNVPLVFMSTFSRGAHACLTLTLLTWRIWWAPTNASKWQMGFNSAFKGLKRKKWFKLTSEYVHWISYPLAQTRLKLAWTAFKVSVPSAK